MTKSWYELGHQWRETPKSLRLWELNLISYLISPTLFYGTRSFTLYLVVCPGKLFRWHGCLQLYSLEVPPVWSHSMPVLWAPGHSLPLFTFQTCVTSPLKADLPTHKSSHHISPWLFFFDAKLNNSFFSLPLISQGFQASPLAFTKSVTFDFLLNCKARSGASSVQWTIVCDTQPGSPTAQPPDRSPGWSTLLLPLPQDTLSILLPPGPPWPHPPPPHPCFNPGPPYPHLDHWSGLQWLSYLYPLTVAIHLSSCSPFLIHKPVHITHLQRHNPSGFRIRL